MSWTETILSKAIGVGVEPGTIIPVLCRLQILKFTRPGATIPPTMKPLPALCFILLSAFALRAQTILTSAPVPARGGNRLNIQYGQANGQKLLLDVHVPAGQGPFPILIIVHG
ncbi:MAG: hypothetical protein ACRED1_07780, partial [Limisphaerales bacterium]